MPKILIVGGGPAGCAAGIVLAKKGFEVLLFEKGSIDNEKICGDGLAPDAQRALKELGVFEKVKKEAFEVSQTIVYGLGKKFSAETNFLTLERKRLDRILRDEVTKNHGTVIYRTKIVRIKRNPKEIIIWDSIGRKFNGDCLILATGSDIHLANSLGFSYPAPNATLMRGYALNKTNLNAYMIWFLKDIPGYGWVFPAPNNKLNVGVGSIKRVNIRDELNKFLKKVQKIGLNVEFIETSEIATRNLPTSVRSKRAISECAQEHATYFSGAVLDKPKVWVLRSGLKKGRLSSDRIILAGENIHTTYNLTGEGIGKALESGMIAAKTSIEAKDFNRNSLSMYDKKIEARMHEFHQGYTKAVYVLTNPVLRTLFSLVVHRSDKARKALTLIMNEELNLGKLFTLKGFLDAVGKKSKD